MPKQHIRRQKNNSPFVPQSPVQRKVVNGLSPPVFHYLPPCWQCKECPRCLPMHLGFFYLLTTHLKQHWCTNESFTTFITSKGKTKWNSIQECGKKGMGMTNNLSCLCSVWSRTREAPVTCQCPPRRRGQPHSPLPVGCLQQQPCSMCGEISGANTVHSTRQLQALPPVIVASAQNKDCSKCCVETSPSNELSLRASKLFAP